MSDTTVYISTTLDPQLNLALEESLFRNMQPDSRILLLYRNKPSVIIGRNQNPWIECSLKNMNEDKIPFYRRFSGGGTVYHDPGNINYSYMTPRQKFNRSTATGLMVKSLQLVGVEAEISPRNDILVDGKKISGSAYRISGDKAYHHGTLLVDADLKKLTEYLSSGLSISEAKGTKSVSSFVANITDCNPAISYEKVYHATTSAFTKTKDPDCIILDEKAIQKRVDIFEIVDQLTSLEWLLGKTPNFTIHAVCRPEKNQLGDIPVELEIVKGKIQAIKFSNNKTTSNTEQMEQTSTLLYGTFFRTNEISKILSNTELCLSAYQREFLYSLLTALAEII